MQNDNAETGIAVGTEGRPREICQRTFAFAVRIVRVCQSLDGRPGVNATLARQLLRAGTSVAANLEEAQAGQSRADFINKVSIALKEAREADYWLRLLEATGIRSADDLRGLRAEVNELKRILAAILVSTKKRNQ
ncbi:MAG: four helix bundle protein [Acidobacteriales bacterium]|nr:four helix bundle protein [Terriglobales bacterium]